MDGWRDVATSYTVRRVRDRQTLDVALDVMEQAFGPRSRPDDVALEAQVEACGPGRRIQRFVIYEGDQPVCGGGLNLYPDLGFGFLWGGGTAPEAPGSVSLDCTLG